VRSTGGVEWGKGEGGGGGRADGPLLLFSGLGQQSLLLCQLELRRFRCKQPRVFVGDGCASSVGRVEVDELRGIPEMAVRARA
jgi:hypothetical protein